MERCKDCRFWEREDIPYAMEPDDWGICNVEDYEGARMEVEDGYLKTAPDFGCVDFEPRVEDA